MKSVASAKFIDSNGNLSHGLEWLDWEGEYRDFTKAIAEEFAKDLEEKGKIPKSAVSIQILVGTMDNGKMKAFIIDLPDWSIVERKVL